MSITGEPDASPTKVGVALVDVLTSKDAVIGILAALRSREGDGYGQRIQVNLLSSLLASLANQASAFLTTDEAPARLGNAHPSIAPYELLACADGPIAVACGNNGQFERMCAVLGEPELAHDHRFAANSGRVQHRQELVRALEMLLGSATARHWVDALTAVGVPAGLVGSLSDGFALATALGLEPRVDMGPGHPDQVSHPISFGRTPVTSYAPPPHLGQHSDEVRAWIGTEPGLDLRT